MLEYSARLAAGDHCHLPTDTVRACLTAAAMAQPAHGAAEAGQPREEESARPAFDGEGSLEDRVVWANMYDVAQLVDAHVIKRLASARGGAIERDMAAAIAHLARRTAAAPPPPTPRIPLPLPLAFGGNARLDVVLLSSSFDGDHYVTHAVAALVAALHARPPCARRARGVCAAGVCAVLVW